MVFHSLHYHLSQHGVFSEDDVSTMEPLFKNVSLIEILSLKRKVCFGNWV